MKIKRKFELFNGLFLSIMLMACSFVTKAMPTPTGTPSSVPNTSTPEATPTITVTSTPQYEVKAGKTMRVRSGGYSFSQIKGYVIVGEDNIGAYLKSSDEKVEVGLFAYPRPSGMAISGLISSWRESFENDYDDISFADPVEETKEEIGSISAEFTGTDDGTPIQGRLIIYEPPHAKVIYMYTLAHGDQRWQREGQKVFEITANSIKLFEITALQICPVTKDTDYGYVKTSPIKIGGGSDYGWVRIHNYLGILLGRNGEIVGYNSGKPTTYGGVDLDVYVLRIGNDYKVLYFDRSNFEDLHVPYGLSCSAPLPGKPGSGPASSG